MKTPDILHLTFVSPRYCCSGFNSVDWATDSEYFGISKRIIAIYANNVLNLRFDRRDICVFDKNQLVNSAGLEY